MDDLSIANAARIKHIREIAGNIGLDDKDIDMYGRYKAKIDLAVKDRGPVRAKMVLVTSMNPTPAGEGKTTLSIGLADALNKIGEKTIVTLREPSLGPFFGMKGGATGGGFAQVVPMEDINLHFTGDIHAVTASHNLIAAMLDNSYSRHNEFEMEPKTILWHRVMDMNDRALRGLVIGLDDEESGQIRQSRFDITASSEIMAILGLSCNIDDLKRRIGNIIIAVSKDNKPIMAKSLNCQGAAALLLKDAVRPNLVQTLEGNPAIIHAGPFANIAHGTNSVIALCTARRLSDMVIVESGFGSDLGGEKFFDIVSRHPAMQPPDAVVIVATVRAVKYHGGVKKNDLDTENTDAVKKGFCNLEKHIENMLSFNRPVIISVNKFDTDSEEEIKLLKAMIEEKGVSCYISEVWGKGSAGALDLAQAVWDIAHKANGEVNYVYEAKHNITEKIQRIAKRIYGAGSVLITRKIRNKIAMYEEWGYSHLPVCIAKTQYSFSDEADKLGRPEGFDLEVKDVRIDSGAEFAVVYLGDIMTMPGLPAKPAAERMDIDNQGDITGIF